MKERFSIMNKTKNNITELIFILDRSGSMSGLESDTIGGFNSLIEKQKKQDGECIVSTVLFDDESRVIHDRVSLDEIRECFGDDVADLVAYVSEDKTKTWDERKNDTIAKLAQADKEEKVTYVTFHAFLFSFAKISARREKCQIYLSISEA